MSYYRDSEGCFVRFIEVMCTAGVALIFVILALRLVLGLVPPGFWGS